MVKIVSIHKFDSYYAHRKDLIGKTGTFETEGKYSQHLKVSGFSYGWFYFRSKKLGWKYFFAIKVEKITRKRRKNGN